jgi:hypothetical protein
MTPTKSRSDYPIISWRAKKVLNFRVAHFSATGAWPRISQSIRTNDLRDDAARERNAGSPGSGGAPPYLRRGLI